MDLKYTKATELKNLVMSMYDIQHVRVMQNNRYRDMFAFTWDELPGDDSQRFIRFLYENLNVKWIEEGNVDIRREDDGETIIVSNGSDQVKLMMGEKQKLTLDLGDNILHPTIKTLKSKAILDFLNVNESLFKFMFDIKTAEDDVKEDIRQKAIEFPIYEWIVGQKGISFDMAGQMIGLIGDIEKFVNVSKLWSYAGMGVIQVCQRCGKRYLPIHDRPAYIQKTSGRLLEQWEKKISKEAKPDFSNKADSMLCHCEDPDIKSLSQRRIKGTLLDYNPRLKSLCWRYGKQFIMQGDFYRSLFEKFRNQYEQRPDLIAEVESKSGKITRHGSSKGTAHILAMAQRKTEKIFLQHLWANWRKIEGLPVTMPYIIEKGGHTSYIDPPGPEVKPIAQRT